VSRAGPLPEPTEPRRARRGSFAWSLLSGLALATAAIVTGAQSSPAEYERPPINYSHTKPADAVARLLKRIAAGEITWAGTDQAILRTLLHELGVPVESQLVVFSKTSLQAGLIEPGHPRALYFSDSVYVGWVPGGLIEVAAVDAELGPVFYGFDPQDARDARRTLVRETSCLRCHGGTFVRDIPGLFARSLITTVKGEPLLRQGSEVVDDETPFEQRWGGWYVTGYTGKPSHRGNAFGLERGDHIEFNPSDQRPMELSKYFDPSEYLTNTSDVVALLVFQHQLAMHNSLTRAAQRFRRMLDEQRSQQTAAHEPVTDEPASDREKNVLANAAEDVLDHLLFRNAAALPTGINGTDAFRRAFANDARRSREGDALKDLSLQGRLFANRCSFLIYSDAFTALPAALKARVFDGLDAALHANDPGGRYAYLEPAEKRRILEVLSETLPDAQPRFQLTAQPGP
jgi:hypothetical protein